MISGLQQLNSVCIVSPCWQMPVFKAQALKSLPSTLLHLTIWTGELELAPGAPQFLSEFSFSESFPKLETLRICAANSAGPERLPYNLDHVPSTVRTLTLIFPGKENIANTAFTVVQPIGHEPGARSADQVRADFHLTYSATEQDRASWKYRFPQLEYFEWGSTTIYPILTPHEIIPAKLPPTLKHYIENHCSLFPMATVSHSATYNDLGEVNGLPKTEHAPALQTFILSLNISESLIRALPPTIKTLSLPRGNIWNGANFANLFPSLTSLHSPNAFDVNKVIFPSTLSSLEWRAAHKSDAGGFFATNAPPASLTSMSVMVQEVSGLFHDLPTTLRHLSIVGAVQGSYLSKEVFPFLPKQLRSLRLKVRSFSPEYLAMLPRELDELDVTAESMMLLEWKPGGVWDNAPTLFDVSELPPRLKRLRLRVEPYGILFPSSFFAKLPRTLTSLEVTETFIDSIPASTSSSSSEASSSASSSAPPQPEKKGILDTITGWFKSEDPATPPIYTDHDIAESLKLLPEGCWIATRFRARIPGDSRKNRLLEPTDFVRSIQRHTPGGITLAYTLGHNSLRDYDFFN